MTYTHTIRHLPSGDHGGYYTTLAAAQAMLSAMDSRGVPWVVEPLPAPVVLHGEAHTEITGDIWGGGGWNIIGYALFA